MELSVLYNKLINQPERIEAILTALDYTDIRYIAYQNQFRFAREVGRNPTSCLLNCNTLQYHMFSVNKHGNIFSLIMDKIKCSFPEALQFAAIKAGISLEELNIQVRLPFGGFYRDLVPSRPEENPLATYSENILIPYAGIYNTRFLKDGVDFNTQEVFGIGYDTTQNRITIPERSLTGELVGIMTRSNSDDCPHGDRWLPYVPCARSKTLYGYANNYMKISTAKTIVLMESEKAVMQTYSFGIHNVLAICGCHVSDYQRNHVMMLGPERVILALDEGLEEEQIRDEAEKLAAATSTRLIQVKIGYVWDGDDNELLAQGSKDNIADLGLDAYKYGLRNKVKWLGVGIR